MPSIPRAVALQASATSAVEVLPQAMLRRWDEEKQANLIILAVVGGPVLLISAFVVCCYLVKTRRQKINREAMW